MVIPRVELAIKSANASSGRTVDGNVLEQDRREFWDNIEGIQETASSRINSRTELKRIDETRGNNTKEESNLLFNGRNINRQTHTLHKVTEKTAHKKLPNSSLGMLQLIPSQQNHNN